MFYGTISFIDNVRKFLWNSAQVPPQKSQQCGQSATHDGMFLYSPAMFIAAMVMKHI